MPPTIRHVTVDCHDPEAVGRFWQEVLDWPDDPDNPNEAGDPEWIILPPAGAGPGLLFLGVSDDKVVKNRWHLDLQPDQPRDEEVARLQGLGATVVADHRNDDDTGWVTMADVEGNEFCVERSAAERTD